MMDFFYKHTWFGLFLLGGLLSVKWNGFLGCGVMALGIFLFGLPILAEDLRGEGGYWMTREEADYELRSITGDLTPVEMKAVEDEERAVQKKNDDATWNTDMHWWSGR
jgi:hypothetical protein